MITRNIQTANFRITNNHNGLYVLKALTPMAKKYLLLKDIKNGAQLIFEDDDALMRHLGNLEDGVQRLSEI